jgi:hypothetical protein
LPFARPYGVRVNASFGALEPGVDGLAMLMNLVYVLSIGMNCEFDQLERAIDQSEKPVNHIALRGNSSIVPKY